MRVLWKQGRNWPLYDMINLNLEIWRKKTLKFCKKWKNCSAVRAGRVYWGNCSTLMNCADVQCPYNSLLLFYISINNELNWIYTFIARHDPNAAPPCDYSNCTLPDCFCSSDGTLIPGGDEPAGKRVLHELGVPSVRARHFRYFWILSIIKSNFLHFFYQVDNLFLHQFYLKSPLPVKFTWWKMQKTSFLIIEEKKKYRKCPALLSVIQRVRIKKCL